MAVVPLAKVWQQANCFQTTKGGLPTRKNVGVALRAFTPQFDLEVYQNLAKSARRAWTGLFIMSAWRECAGADRDGTAVAIA
jgi:hypothetical protein